MSPSVSCKICDTLKPNDLIELNTLLADPSRWPREAFGKTQLPTGPLPIGFRRWGAVKMGLLFLEERGYTAAGTTIARHWKYDVPHMVDSLGELAEINAGDRPATGTNLMAYLNSGLSLGAAAMKQLQERVEASTQEGGVPIAIDTLYKIAAMGAKIAVAQGNWLARKNGDSAPADEDDGFRKGSAPAAPKIGAHTRIFTIDGQAQPVYDEGPADRDRYNARAVQEGSPLLPARPPA